MWHYFLFCPAPLDCGQALLALRSTWARSSVQVADQSLKQGTNDLTSFCMRLSNSKAGLLVYGFAPLLLFPRKNNSARRMIEDPLRSVWHTLGFQPGSTACFIPTGHGRLSSEETTIAFLLVRCNAP